MNISGVARRNLVVSQSHLYYYYFRLHHQEQTRRSSSSSRSSSIGNYHSWIEMKFPSCTIGQVFLAGSILTFPWSSSSVTTVRAFTNTTPQLSRAFTTKKTIMTPPAAAAASVSTQSGGGDVDITAMDDTTTTVSLSKYVTDRLDNSWINQLSPETDENLQKSKSIERLSMDDDNRTKRPVFNGHYVLVKPQGLKNPRLVLVSNDVATNLLGFQSHHVESNEFVQWVSGNGLSDDVEYGWATPYALSIVGTRYTSNCPYGTGVGYGDGRAISIAELNGYELQLKGGGPTPFCRGADGRAVLRSSIREFLASEAMHYLGIRTTRALSLVKSEGPQGHTVNRPWYSDNAQLQIPSENDPRLASYSPEERKVVIQQLRQRKADPNVMIQEPCAITCRVAPSFVRVGHVDLHARRVIQHSQQQSSQETTKKYDTSTLQYNELKDMVWHACYREYKKDAYDPYFDKDDIIQASKTLLTKSADRLATMVTHWVRVGFAQGNFNADNCLVGGHTMDYGPFGFMDEYSPLFAKWTGSGQHFGFLNQPSAGLANYQVLVESVVPLIVASEEEMNNDDNDDFDADDRETELVQHFMDKAQSIFQQKTDEIFCQKMGLSTSNSNADALWETLESLMRVSRVDWTLFWRQLSYMVDQFPLDSQDYGNMLDKLIGDQDSTTSPFYEPLSSKHRADYISWIEQWRNALQEEQEQDLSVIGNHMKQVNPKYVLREWMLVDAYTAAAKGDESVLKELYELIQRPYEEGAQEEQNKYYGRAHDAALTTGGTAFMS